MSDLKYAVIIRPIDESEGGGYLALAPDLPGCIADGETPSAALADLQSAIGEWIDEAHRVAQRVPDPGEAAAQPSEESLALKKLVYTQREVIEKQREALRQREMALSALAALELKINELEANLNHLISVSAEHDEDPWSRPHVSVISAVRRKQFAI